MMDGGGPASDVTCDLTNEVGPLKCANGFSLVTSSIPLAPFTNID